MSDFVLYLQSIGIWVIFPDEPLGPSKKNMQKFEARHTAIPEFINNVVHSNARVYKNYLIYYPSLKNNTPVNNLMEA